MKSSKNAPWILVAGLVVGCGSRPQPPASPAPCCSAVTVASSKRSPRTYGMDDLEALATAHGFRELVEHLDDIPPAQRDDRWRALATRACSERLGEAVGREDDLALAHASIDLANRFPFLSEAPAFRTIAGTVGARGVAMCGRFEDCADSSRLLGIAHDSKKTVEAAHAAARAGRRPLAMSMYAAAAADATSVVCGSDEALELALEGRDKEAGSPFRADAEALLTRCRAYRAKP